MRITTLDPVTLEDVTDLESAPYLIEGQGEHALKIYFASEDNKREYLDLEVHGSNNSASLRRIFDAAADSPITGTIN